MIMTKHKNVDNTHFITNLFIKLYIISVILYALWYVLYLHKIYVHVHSPGRSQLIDLLTPILCHIIVMERLTDCQSLQEFDHLASNLT